MSKTSDSPSVRAISEGLRAQIWRTPSQGFDWGSDLGQFAPREVAEGPKPDHGPWLVPLGPFDQEYPLVRKRDLLGRFIALARNPTREKIRRFANRFGPLFEPTIAARRSSNLEPVQLPVVDSYQAWYRTATKVAMLWTLWQWVQDGNETALSPFVLWEPDPLRITIRLASVGGAPAPELARQIWCHAPARTDLPPGFFGYERRIFQESDLALRVARGWREGDVVAPMLHCITELVNGELAGHVHMQVMHFSGNPVRYVPDSLHAAVYVRFAEELASPSVQERKCARDGCNEMILELKKPGRPKEYCTSSCRSSAGYSRTGKVARKERLGRTKDAAV